MTIPQSRYAAFERALTDALMGAPGDTPADVRRAVEARAAGRGRPDVPEALAGYVEKVARHAYRVSDADVEALRRAGYSEDAVFEITLAAAAGAGLARLERGLAALRGDG